MTKRFHAVTCPRCRAEGFVDAGIEWGEMRNQLTGAGWRFDGQQWRCGTCYGKWRLARKDKNLVRGEGPEGA